MTEPRSLAETLFLVFVAVPAFGVALFAEVTLVVTVIHRFVQWVDRRWWS